MNSGKLRLRLPTALLAVFFFALHLPSAFAQAVASGSISGRVFNPSSGAFVANAQITVEGTNLSAFTAADGSYTLVNVPAGKATVAVFYTGYARSTATVEVANGSRVTQDFTIAPEGAAKDDVITLQTFTVSSEREGNAKAIMQQRASMNVSNIVAADVFGNVAEGNVGEFVKYLPAIQLDYVEADARSPRIRGLPAQYTSVTMDGMKLASADGFIQNNGTDNGGGAGAGNRSFGFEMISINSIDAVEVNYTTNASQDADAPAGNINLITKHAFERRGRRISVDVSAFANSEDITLNRTVGPDDARHFKIRPNASVDYSDVFFNQRLGVVVSLSESNSYNQQRQFSPLYDITPTATDPRPMVLTRIQYKDGPKFSERSTATFTADFKATDDLTLSLTGMVNNYAALIGNRTFGFSTTRANVTGDGLTGWNNVQVTGVTSTMSYLYKRTHGYTYIPRAVYKRDNLELVLAATASHSNNNYGGALEKGIIAGNVSAGAPPLTGLTVSATRPDVEGYSTVVTQTGGADVADLANYKATATTAPQVTADGRYADNRVYQGVFDAKYTAPWSLPTWFKVGGKITENTFVYKNPTPWQKWNYVGPGGGNGGTWALYPSAFAFDPGHGASILSITGRTVAVQDHNRIADLFYTHPEYFVLNAAPADYYSAFINNPRYVKEEINAAYGMFDVKPIKRLEIQAGIRWEDTKDEIKDFNPLSTNQVKAAGYTVGTNGVATTIEGIKYQYFSQPRVARSTKYSNFYPSASLKYEFTRHLQGLLGYSYTVTRPSYNDIAGVWSVNDDTQTITAPNPNLKPQYADNYSARLAYYFEPVGTLAVGAFENDFKNYVTTATLPGAADQFGYLDPQYDPYRVQTKLALPGSTRFRGLTLEYSQSLSFLPQPFKGLTVFANYTRTYVHPDLPDPLYYQQQNPYNYGWLPGVAPSVVNGGVSYHWRRFKIGVNARWTERMAYSGTYNTWQKASTKIDLNASYQIANGLSVYFQGRNVFNTPDYNYFNNNPQQIRSLEYYGAYFYCGVKAVF